MDLQTSHSTCPFCNRPFKSPGAYANHRKKIHSGQSLPIQWKRETSIHNHGAETSSLKENISARNLCYALCSQYADYSELTALIPPGRDKNERHEDMLYGDDSLVGDRVNHSSDVNAVFNDTIHFSEDREAGKVVASYPFQKLRDT